MNRTYIKTPAYISYENILEKDYILSSPQYTKLIMPNSNYKFVRDFLSRTLKRTDLGVEVGSHNYINESPYYFLRTKALQQHSFLLDINSETSIPMMPRVFLNQNLKEGDLLISKDSNIGEIVILDKDYPNFMLSSAIYKLPIQEYKYYLLAFVKHQFFREQLDFMVPKGATIRHAKALFLNCKIPLPNKKRKETIRYIEILMQAIINKEKLIKEHHEQILIEIEKELLSNQKNESFNYSFPGINEIEKMERLDTGLYNKNFKYWNQLVLNYKYGSKDLLSRGFTWARGTSLENNAIKTRIDSDSYIKGFYELVLPTNISQYGYVDKSYFIGTSTKLKIISKGDIIFGGEGFGKGRTYVVIDDTANVATNYHGIRIINNNNDLTESIFIRCFLAFWRHKGMIDYIGVGGSGGHCAPSYFHLIETPLFPKDVIKNIIKHYHNTSISYEAITKGNLDNFLNLDNDYNKLSGIYELAMSIKYLNNKMNEAIDNVINDNLVTIKF